MSSTITNSCDDRSDDDDDDDDDRDDDNEYCAVVEVSVISCVCMCRHMRCVI